LLRELRGREFESPRSDQHLAIPRPTHAQENDRLGDPRAFGAALADPSRRTILITGEGSHQLTANDVGAMGRFGANVIVFVLNNSGHLVERALEENPNWTYTTLLSGTLNFVGKTYPQRLVRLWRHPGAFDDPPLRALR
jgi:thiamine pyrophosphate-dependent enzyme